MQTREPRRARDVFAQLGQRNRRGVRRQQRVGFHLRLDRGVQIALGLGFFDDRFDQQVGVRHACSQIGDGADAPQGGCFFGLAQGAFLDLAVQIAAYGAYQTGRLGELTEERGEYTARDAAVSYHQYIQGLSTDYTEELTYPDRKRVHNLKYYTWVEQQGKTYEEIQAQWYQKDYWTCVHGQMEQIDALIEEFNAKVGLL